MQPRHHQCAIHLQSWQQMREDGGEAGGRGWRKRPFHFLSGARPAVRCPLLSYRLGFKHWSLPQQPVQCGPCHLQRSDFEPSSILRVVRSRPAPVTTTSSSVHQPEARISVHENDVCVSFKMIYFYLLLLLKFHSGKI